MRITPLLTGQLWIGRPWVSVFNRKVVLTAVVYSTELKGSLNPRPFIIVKILILYLNIMKIGSLGQLKKLRAVKEFYIDFLKMSTPPDLITNSSA